MFNTPDKRLALQAYEQILELIMSSKVGAGELMSERRLAEALNMSRTPVRDALLMLEGEGLLLRQSRGLQVREMRIEDYMDALQVRLLLEPAMARMATGHIPLPKIRASRARIEAAMAEYGDGPADRDLVRSIDSTVHGMIVDVIENAQLTSIVQTMRRQTQMFDLRSLPERFAGTCKEHLRILDALESGDGVRAAETMTEHLEAVRQSIIDKLRHL